MRDFRSFRPVLLALGLVLANACSKPESDTAAKHEATEEGDFCEGHGVYESHCIKCHPKLRDKFKAAGDYCAEHDFPKSVCPECKIRKPAGADLTSPAAGGTPAAAPGSPEASTAPADKPQEGAAASGLPKRPAVASAEDWCGEHGVPESMCTQCNTKLVEGYKAAGDWCNEHGYPESVCPKCNPLAPPAGAQQGSAVQPGTKIRFKSPETAQAAGIQVMPAAEAALGQGIDSAAEIAFDRNRIAEVSTPLPGAIREVLVDLGQIVKRGQPLFVLESAQAGDLQAQMKAARERVKVAEADTRRQEGLLEAKIASVSEVDLSRKEQEAARADLQALESALRIAGGSAKGSNGRYAVVAPIAGTVVRQPAVLGQYVTAETSLATVADVSSMTARIHVPEWDATALRKDQPVEVKVDGIPEKVFHGQITWIASEVDPKTRTVEARAELPNPDGLLRANQYARASIRIAEPESALVVSRDSIQRLGEESVLFVQTGNGVYEPRIAKLGRSEGNTVQVVADLKAGDPVVTTGAFLLKTEISKESIGAGCCEVEGP